MKRWHEDGKAKAVLVTCSVAFSFGPQSGLKSIRLFNHSATDLTLRRKGTMTSSRWWVHRVC